MSVQSTRIDAKMRQPGGVRRPSVYSGNPVSAGNISLSSDAVISFPGFDAQVEMDNLRAKNVYVWMYVFAKIVLDRPLRGRLRMRTI